jgi:hypothetical protein
MKELWFRSKDQCFVSISDGDAFEHHIPLEESSWNLISPSSGALRYCFIIGVGDGGILSVVTLLETSSWSSIRSMLSHVG